MKDYQAKNIRNIAVVGHGSEGKTTLVEALLFSTGAIDRQGRVEDGTTTTDSEPEEKRRQISLSAAVAPLEWKDVKVNLIDVPGYFDFAGEMVGPLAVAEGAIITVGAVSGMNVGAEKAWAMCDKTRTSRMIVINQMDRENANFSRALKTITDKYGSHIAPIEIPIMEGGKFTGVVCVLENKAFVGEGKALKEIDIPANMASDVDAAREAIMEAAAGADDELMEKYFEEGELSPEEIMHGLRKGILDATVVPVVCCSGITRVGLAKLLDNLIDLMPSPAGTELSGVSPKTGEPETRPCEDNQPFSARVFKTLADPFVGKLSLLKVTSGVLAGDTALYNANAEKIEKAGNLYFLRGNKQTPAAKVVAGDICAIAKLTTVATGNTLCDPNKPIRFEELEFPAPCLSMAVYAKKAGEEDKIFSGLSRLMEEDPTIRVEKNAETTESVLSGLGELHIEVIARKLANKFGAECVLQYPKIPYRESIRKKIDVQGRHKKQSGGHGQFGDVWIEFRPNDDPSDTEFHFEDAVVGGVVPRNFIPAVEKGLRDNIKRGVLAGFPVVGLTAKLHDGSYHAVDSSEMAFKTAARIAFKKLVDASPVLLEPIYGVKVFVPDEYMGDVIGDMNKRRGRIMGMAQENGLQCVTAEAPLAEMYKYATDLRSMTQARGFFTMQFERYEEVPAADAKKIIENTKREEEEEE
ncbi:MAG: Elongation factor G [Firmicutes bacterium ADurb.Bin467]|jgi:elongation factor G|nr:MAG: Elongation factor G [Firmicutes bacterium ADurb.Bin467]